MQSHRSGKHWLKKRDFWGLIYIKQILFLYHRTGNFLYLSSFPTSFSFLIFVSNSTLVGYFLKAIGEQISNSGVFQSSLNIKYHDNTENVFGTCQYYRK